MGLHHQEVVVVLQPDEPEGFHTTLLEDALTVLVLLGEELMVVAAFQYGSTRAKYGWKCGV